MKITIRSLANRTGRRMRVLAALGAGALVVGVGTALATALATSTTPANTALPTISGSATVGSTLTANPGTWSGATPLTFAYQWLLCNTSGGSCAAISGATGQSFAIPTADLSDTVAVSVTATNSSGTTAAQSTSTAAITAPTALSSSALPTISGTPAVADTLTAQPGTWAGSQPISYTYQWLVCAANGSSCSAITGATDSTYLVTSTDVASTLSVEVTATNAAGSSTDESAQTATVTSTSAAGCPTVASGQTVAASEVAAPSRLQVAITSSSAPLSTSTTSFTATVRVTDTCGQPVSGAEVYMTAVPYNQFTIPAQQTTGSNGEVTMSFTRSKDFPVDRSQQLLVLFIRASRPGDPALAGISTTRLVSLPIK